MTTAVVICPGRGTYNKAELGYLARYFPDTRLLAQFDAQRKVEGRVTLKELDGADRYSLSVHSRGDNASALIYAATLGDFLSINRAEIEIVAVTGNSMGWYSALACGGAVSATDGLHVANTMGTLMQQALIGGQLVYPCMADDWRPDADRRAKLLQMVDEIDASPDQILALSIDLGGMLVLAGNDAGLSAFIDAAIPIDDRFPMRLGNHAAFHTVLQEPVAQEGRRQLPVDLFKQPDVPLIDGRGAIWWPNATDIQALRAYTLGAQVTQTFNFTHAIEIAAREFAPDLFIITGPGTTLGGAVAQSLILANWRGMTCKDDFKALQDSAPVLASMGLPKQRPKVAAVA